MGAALLLASCTQGLQLTDGERGEREVKTVAFLFSDGVAEVTVTPPAFAPAETVAAAAPALQPPASEATARAPRRVTAPVLALAPTAAPNGTSAPSLTAPPAESTAGPEPTTSVPQIDTSVIAANPIASQIAVPHAEVDPGLTLFGETPDPDEVLAPELLAQAGLQSFFITGSQRQPTAPTGSDLVRPIQFVQRIFVHDDAAAALNFYVALRDEVVPNLATGALAFFGNFYPNLEPSARTTDQFAVATQNQLTEIRIDPLVPADQRTLGPEDPHVYYILLREGSVTAVLEIFYLAPQDPRAVTLIGERLVLRIPDELKPAL
jgi:hypothetical protein